MRVASLVPSGTLMLRALGVEPVGVSHSCPNPTGLPVLTESLIPEGLSQEEIDRRVREAYREGLSLYRVRGSALRPGPRPPLDPGGLRGLRPHPQGGGPGPGFPDPGP
jgi:iron complex transport system substrate-binding protein